MGDIAYNIVMDTDVNHLEFLRGGEKFCIPVHICNNSNRDLVDTQLIYLSYHVLSMDGQNDQWDNKRFSMQLLRGEENIFQIEDTVPSKKGTYLIQFDIVKEGVEWFSSKGVEVPSVKIQVLHDGSALFHQLVKDLEKQKAEENEWKELLKSGQFDFYHPYLKVNPYGIAPLSAIILFTSAAPMAVKIHIEGKTKNACIDAEFSEYAVEHIIPIYGLYPGKVNMLSIQGIEKGGKIKEHHIEIPTEELGHGFENISLITYTRDENQYAFGLNFCYTGLECQGMKMAYDINGDIRWYFTEVFSEPAKYLSNSSVWFAKQGAGDGYQKEAFIYEYNLLGRILSVYCSPYGAHHDIQFTAKNTMLVLGNSLHIRYDKLVEIDLETGCILGVNDYKQILQRTRNVGVIYSNADWLHANAVIEHKGDFIISGNTQSSIVKHDRSGSIKWIFAESSGYGTYWKQFLLKPIGNGFEYPYNQHAIEVLPDRGKNPHEVDILLFDNGSSRNIQEHKDSALHPLYSRMVHYRIDEKKKTVRQIWEYGKERPELFSMWRGDADLLENGNFIGVFNIRQENQFDGKNYTEHCVAVEVDKEKHVIWECYGCSMTGRNSYQNYRIERKAIYGSNEKNIDLNQEVKIRLPETGREEG